MGGSSLEGSMWGNCFRDYIGGGWVYDLLFDLSLNFVLVRGD